MPQDTSTKVVTGKVLLGYVYLPPGEPREGDDGGKGKYQCMVVVPKTDKATIKALKAAQAAAFEAGKSTKFQNKPPRGSEDFFGMPNGTVKDGDEDADLERNPELAGCLYFNVSASTKPGVVDRNREPITDPDEVYSGIFARVSLNAYAYNYQGKKGVTFGLNNVQKLADGEPLGGRSRAEDDFDELDDEDDDLV